MPEHVDSAECHCWGYIQARDENARAVADFETFVEEKLRLKLEPWQKDYLREWNKKWGACNEPDN